MIICCNYICGYTALYSSTGLFYMNILHHNPCHSCSIDMLAATFYQFTAGCRGEWQCVHHTGTQDKVSLFIVRPYSSGEGASCCGWSLVVQIPACIEYMFRSATLTVESDVFRCLKCFNVVIYVRTSSLECLNEARRELFCQKNRTMENIPPMQDALQQHSNHNMHPIRLEFGLPVTSHNKKHPHQKSTVGH